MAPALPTIATYAVALAATLVLANYLTPARWWRRPTARNLAIVAAGTWGIAALLLPTTTPAGGAPPAAHAPAALRAKGPSTPPAPAGTSAAGGALAGASLASFRVHRALNLRAAPATAAPRLATVAPGALVTPTGARQGDWWQIQAEADGRRHTGWASSLWLRRQNE